MNNQQPRKFVVALVLPLFFLSIGFSGACNNSSHPTTGQLTKLTIAEGMQPIVAPVYVADEKGFFKQQGLDVQLVPFSKGKLCLDAVIGGQTNIGTVAETPLMHIGFQNQPIVILTTMETADENIKCVARKDKGINSPVGLKGHRVGVPIGGNAEYFMDTFLKKYGLTRNDVTIVNLNPPEMVGAIVGGDIDASFSWEPHISRTLTQLGDKAILFPSSGLYRETFNIVSLKEWAENNSKTCEQLLRALHQATQFIESNKDESIAIVAKRINLEPAELAGIWNYYTFKLMLDQSLMNSMIDQAKWAIASKTQVGPVPDYSYMFYTAPLQSIVPDAVKLDLAMKKQAAAGN